MNFGDIFTIAKNFPVKALKGFFIGCLIGLITWFVSSIFKGTLYYPMLFIGSSGVGLYCGLFFSNQLTKFGVIFVFTTLTYIAMSTNIRDVFGGNEQELLSYIATYGFLCLIFGGGIDSISTWSNDESKKS
ncbi:hypothetical protein [Pseudanabaena sp. PCC 6802]|uniref:hypothetical protein n=1 Tax=Pseudanabaena sp. PCC 6802 TaxID=118173 RepID=UPI000363B685|nr:hypothetical protein [Pseudanabaena sp. PCC 6802]